MLQFKEILHQDLKNVFFRDDCLTDRLLINGKVCDALLYRNGLAEEDAGQKTNLYGREVLGLYRRLWTLYVPVAQLGGKPPVGSRMTVGEHRYFTVVSVEDQAAMYVLELEEVAT